MLVVIVALALVVAFGTAPGRLVQRPGSRPSLRSLGMIGEPVALRALPHRLGATDGAIPFRTRPPSAHGAAAADGAGIPAVALAAYEHAAFVMLLRDPSCHLSWEDVAGIGRVESDNGLTFGSAARVTANGTLFPPIFGPELDGQDGFPAIATSDGGRLEQEKTWARAVGPMQFLPGTWYEYAQDGNGDGVKDPQNFYDAALTTAVFLCANGGTLATPGGLRAAILAYNDSESYLSLVTDWIGFYTRVGAAGLAAAGSGLLPVGTPAPGGAAASERTGPAGGPGTASPAVRLAAAAATTEATGSFAFTLEATSPSGASLASGSGAVDVADSAASLVLGLPAFGSVQVRVIGANSYVALPQSLALSAGVKGSWAQLSPTLLGRLPVGLGEALTLAQDDAAWTVAQLEGANSTVQVTAHRSEGGLAETEYQGPVSPALAAQRLPTGRQPLGALAQLLAGPVLTAAAWVDGSGLVRAATLSLALRQPSGGSLPAQVSVAFSGYGAPVVIDAPTTSPLGPVPGTTTTTTVPPTLPTSTTTSTTTTTVPRTGLPARTSRH